MRQRLAGEQATIEHERSRSAELGEEAALQGRNLLAMSDKAGDARSRLKAAEAELAAALASREAAADAFSRRGAELAQLATEYETARQAAESRRQDYVSGLQRAATLASQVEAGQTRIAAIQQSVMQHQRQIA